MSTFSPATDRVAKLINLMVSQKTSVNATILMFNLKMQMVEYNAAKRYRHVQVQLKRATYPTQNKAMLL